MYSNEWCLRCDKRLCSGDRRSVRWSTWRECGERCGPTSIRRMACACGVCLSALGESQKGRCSDLPTSRKGTREIVRKMDRKRTHQSWRWLPESRGAVRSSRSLSWVRRNQLHRAKSPLRLGTNGVIRTLWARFSDNTTAHMIVNKSHWLPALLLYLLFFSIWKAGHVGNNVCASLEYASLETLE